MSKRNKPNKKPGKTFSVPEVQPGDQNGFQADNAEPLSAEEIEERLAALSSSSQVQDDSASRLARPIGYARKHGGLPPNKKSLGQNWLEDPYACSQIASAVMALGTNRVLEVGPGAGALTEALLEKGASVTAVEIDQRMIEVLGEHWPDHSRFKVFHEDILQVDWADLMEEKPFILAGNLPYHITSNLMFHAMDMALERPGVLKGIVLLMQLEVVHKIIAEPGDSEYGILAVFTRLWGEPELILEVPRTAFQPPPKVDAGVLMLPIGGEPRYPVPHWQTFKRLVKGTFSKRRKMLRNSMSGISGIGPWEQIDFDWSRRPQTISAEEYAWLAAQLIPQKVRKFEG